MSAHVALRVATCAEFIALQLFLGVYYTAKAPRCKSAFCVVLRAEYATRNGRPTRCTLHVATKDTKPKGVTHTDTNLSAQCQEGKSVHLALRVATCADFMIGERLPGILYSSACLVP